MSGITGFAPIHINNTSRNGVFYSTEKLRQRLEGLLRDGYKEAAIGMLKGYSTPLAKHYLGMLLLQGNSPGDNTVAEALQYLQEANLTSSHYTLGMIYLKGQFGVEQNEKLALHHLEIAAKEGDKTANLILGYIYWKGLCGVAGSESIATQYITPSMILASRDKLSDQLLLELQEFVVDHSDAAAVLSSTVLSLGHFTDPDIKEKRCGLQISLADKLIAKEGGSPYLRSKVSKIWHDVQQQYKDSEKLPSKIAKAFTYLGKLSYTNAESGTKQQIRKAVFYWTKAAEAGDIQAKYYLGLAYCSGKGVKKKDLAKGKEFLGEASGEGFLPATTMLNYLEKKRSERGKDQEILAEIDQVKTDELDLGSKPEKDCITANKNFLKRAWSWIKKPGNLGNVIGGILGVAAIVAAVVGVVFFAIAQPYIFLGILAVAAVVVGGGIGFFCAFGAGGH